MNEKDLFMAFSELDDDILERSEAAVTPKTRRKASAVRKWGILAACIALVTSLAGAAVAAEQKEYNEAVEFFESNGLSTEGLSRSDVKAVYRDITTNRFTCDKTEEVLKQKVSGSEISQREPTPDELEDMKNSGYAWIPPEEKPGINYSMDWQYKPHELFRSVLDKTVVDCYRDGELLWETEFPEFNVEDCVFTSAGTAVWGFEYIHNILEWYEDNKCSWRTSHVYSVARVDENGNILWKRRVDHGFEYEYIKKVIDNGDGTLAVISWGDYKYLCLSQYDIDGNELSSHKIDLEDRGFMNAVRLGDGYLVQFRDGNAVSGSDHLVKLDKDGNLTESFTYEGEDCDYLITEMTEFGGKVYLSGYALSKDYSDRWEEKIDNYFKKLESQGDITIDDVEVTQIERESRTAVLLVCDPNGGKPETFYSVKGSRGADLSVNSAGELEWTVNRIIKAIFSPYTNFSSIFGRCQVFRYAFDTDGNLIKQEDTGETVPYFFR